MCGIVGYVGPGSSREIVHEGLRNLEYRGYDSAGIALVGDDLAVSKTAGRVDDLAAPRLEDAAAGIGHTRWSTHGEPTDENAHPHTDCGDRVAVVHNGIIENYDVLRSELADSHGFRSATDTEVVPHLIEDELEAGAALDGAVRSVVDRLEGTYAICVAAAGHDGLVVARQDSPLVLGHGADATFVASDVTAFIDHTSRVTYLENGDIAHVTADDVTISQDGDRVERPRETVDWSADAAEKGGYDHFMLKEIHEQPHALRQTLSGRVDQFDSEVDLDLDLPAEYVNSLEEIQVIGCGTSYHAGLYARELLEEYADIRVTVDRASEYEFRGGRDPWRTLVVAITQSGETADTLGALRRASSAGARTLAITNTVGSSVTREADETLFIRAGPEIGVAATKTFVSQVATATLLTIQLAQARNTITTSDASDLIGDIRRLPGTIQQLLDREDSLRSIAHRYADSEAFFYIGRRTGHPVALEAALKLTEISYDHAEGFPAGTLKHGPLALVTPETPVIALLTEGAAPERTLNNVKEVEARGAPVLGVTTLDAADAYCSETIAVPDLGPLSALVGNIALQLFAYHIADKKGRAIDKPRNLAKSVTVR